MCTQDYHELRVLLEEMVRAWPGAITHPALDAACAYLRTHCHECGTRLTVEQSATRRELCPACSAHTLAAPAQPGRGREGARKGGP